MAIPKVYVRATVDEVMVLAAQRVVEAAGKAMGERGSFTLGLSGGSTPRPLYELLAEGRFAAQIDWPRVEIYFVDERCVPPDHADSNYRMINEALLSKVPLQAGNVHRMKGEIDPETAAIEYGRMLKARFGDGGVDMALLGMGKDGHTASLFPGTAALAETHHRCVANFVPELKTWRITMSAPFLNRSGEVLVLVTGGDKAQRVAEALEGDRDPQRLPIQLVNPADGQMVWVMDAAAAGME